MGSFGTLAKLPLCYKRYVLYHPRLHLPCCMGYSHCTLGPVSYFILTRYTVWSYDLVLETGWPWLIGSACLPGPQGAVSKGWPSGARRRDAGNSWRNLTVNYVLLSCCVTFYPIYPRRPTCSWSRQDFARRWIADCGPRVSRHRSHASHHRLRHACVMACRHTVQYE